MAVIDKHDELLDHCKLHASLGLREPENEPVTAVLVGGSPPLIMRYLAHDLEVSVRDHDDGVMVKIEDGGDGGLLRAPSWCGSNRAPAQGASFPLS